MNQFFSFERFTLLVSKHWADNKKRYVLSVVAFIGLLITWFVFSILTRFDRIPMGQEIQMATYFFLLFATGSLYASQFFNDLGSRAKGINYLLVPASTFEKLLCSLLYTTLLFCVVYTACFYLADVLMVGVANALTKTLPAGEKIEVINIIDKVSVPFNDDQVFNFLFFFLFIQSAFLLGSVYFGKYSFIKTVISGFIVAFIIFCLTFFFYEKLLPPGNNHQGFLTSYRVHVNGVNDHLVQIPRWIGQVLRFLLLYASAPFLWIVTYYRLKEKQV